MSAARKVLRNQWRDDHPPIFEREAKARAVADRGSKPRERLGFQLYVASRTNPALWRALGRRAKGRVPERDHAAQDRDTIAAIRALPVGVGGAFQDRLTRSLLRESDRRGVVEAVGGDRELDP